MCGCGWVRVWFGLEDKDDWEGCYALELSVPYPSLDKQLQGSLMIGSAWANFK